MTVTIVEHPLSPYAQKVKIALDEKGVPYKTELPGGIGSGRADAQLLAANPRAEVPVLLDGDVAIFDSSVILEYIEDRWPEPRLLPADPHRRAKARMIEEVMDTHYEPINWGLGELRWFKRAEGELAKKIEMRAAGQARGLQAWLARQLGDAEWFGGARFGWADLSVVPFLNGSAGFGLAPPPTTVLGRWLARANARESVAKAGKAAADSLAGMANVADAVASGAFKREYRDHRLEWMIRSGGIDIVLAGLKANNIRFSHELS